MTCFVMICFVTNNANTMFKKDCAGISVNSFCKDSDQCVDDLESS